MNPDKKFYEEFSREPEKTAQEISEELGITIEEYAQKIETIMLELVDSIGFVLSERYAQKILLAPNDSKKIIQSFEKAIS